MFVCLFCCCFFFFFRFYYFITVKVETSELKIISILFVLLIIIAMPALKTGSNGKQCTEQYSIKGSNWLKRCKVSQYDFICYAQSQMHRIESNGIRMKRNETISSELNRNLFKTICIVLYCIDN